MQKKSIDVLYKNIGSVLIQCLVKNYSKYMDNDFTMFGPKLLAKFCLRETNVFSNVLASKICQCLECKELRCFTANVGRHFRVIVPMKMNN